MIPYIDLQSQYAQERDELLRRVDEVLEHGRWVGGEEIEHLESEIGEYTGAMFVVAVGSGTDALVLALRALGIGVGDEVITPPNSFIASTSAIVAVGATPVFVDVLDDQTIDPELVKAAITERTRAIMPVHLTGRMADMSSIGDLARQHGIYIIEDAAQSFGSKLDGRFSGTLGDVGCFSAHPLKNFNAAGDAGFVVTPHQAIAERIRGLRNHGLSDRNTVECWGSVSRIDSLQAEILRYRLTRVDSVVSARRLRAQRYRAEIDSRWVDCPPMDGGGRLDSFHTFVIQVDQRDRLRKWLFEHGIDTRIHYPVPIHLQPAARTLGYTRGDFPRAERQASRVVSLPIHQFLSFDHIDHIAEAIQRFYRL